MNGKMKAIVYHAPKDIRVASVDIPSAGADELLVKVDACAVCGTDLKAYLHGNPRIKAPQVMGHEFTGMIEEVGDNVEDFSVGERVVMATSVSCGECFYCKKGLNNLCLNLSPMGFTFPGGMAEYIRIPAGALKNGHIVKVPAGVKAEFAALAEPLSCAVNAAGNSDIQKGDKVLIIGAGPMGIMNACVARLYGADRIILSEINEKRLKMAEKFDIDVLVNPAEDNLSEVVKEQTQGVGADVALVAAPAARPQEEALDLVRKHGTVCLFASLPSGESELCLESRTIHYGEIRVVGTSDSTARQVRQAVRWIETGQLPVDKMVTHILKLEDIFKAFELMQTGEALRVVLKP